MAYYIHAFVPLLCTKRYVYDSVNLPIVFVTHLRPELAP